MKFKKLLAVRWTPKRIIFAAVAMVYLLLATLPASQWLVRQQLRVAAGGTLPNWMSGKMPTEGERERERQTAAAHPDDLSLQLAMAYESRPGIGAQVDFAAPLVHPTAESKAAQAARTLWGLRDRFPNNPSLCANLLRYLAVDAVRIHRDAELAELEPVAKSRTAPDSGVPSPPENTPEHLAWFDEASAIGERLDPGNGYFPAVRAIGLFAAHRDTEALAALHRASTKTEWNEYSADEVRGNWRLMTLTYGEPGSLPRLGQMSSLLFFHYAPLRNAARLATVQAIHRETEGDTANAFTIRHDLVRVGALMRVHSAYCIGTFVGSSLGRTAWERPGGASALPKPNGYSEGARDDDTLKAYCGYLQRIGKPEEAAFVYGEAASGKQIAAVLKQASKRDVYTMVSLLPIAGMWITGTAIISATLVLLVFGAASFLVRRSLLLAHRAYLPVFVVFSFVLLSGSLLFLGNNLITPWVQWLTLFQGIATSDQSAVVVLQWDLPTFLLLLPPVLGAAGFFLPLFLIGVAARQGRKPALCGAAGFVRRYAAAAMAAITVLLMVYAMVAVGTLRLEAAKSSEIDQMLNNENLYLIGR